jgi:hypothetical protein
MVVISRTHEFWDTVEVVIRGSMLKSNVPSREPIVIGLHIDRDVQRESISHTGAHPDWVHYLNLVGFQVDQARYGYVSTCWKPNRMCMSAGSLRRVN